MAAPLVAVFMVFVGRDTVPASIVVRGKKQTTGGVFVVWIGFVVSQWYVFWKRRTGSLKATNMS